MSSRIELNGRVLALPDRPTLLICLDGVGPDLLEAAIDDGVMPVLARATRRGGFVARARGQMPSFTNTNNASIVTGVSPRAHGVVGNTTLDRASGRELATGGLLRATTIFEALEDAGVTTLSVTVKDKLRGMLGARRAAGRSPRAVSVERAGAELTELAGRAAPHVYDPEASLFAFDLAFALARSIDARFVYVSTTDLVQHKHAPRSEASNALLAGVDARLGPFLDAGWVTALTADHGMNDKTRPDGSPNAIFLEDELGRAGVTGARVVLPITDPYVLHHGALGACAWVYADGNAREEARRAFGSLEGVSVLDGDEACARFELPREAIGDLVVLGDARTVLGKSARAHDLEGVRAGLRSHGGLAEAQVPIALLAPLAAGADVASVRSNADALHLALNLVGRAGKASS